MIKEAKITYQADAERDEVKFWNNKSYEEKLSIVQILRIGVNLAALFST